MLKIEQFDKLIYKRIKWIFLFFTFLFFITSIILKEVLWLDNLIRTYIANIFLIILLVSLIISLFGFVKKYKGIVSYILIIISYFSLSLIWLWSLTIITLNWNSYIAILFIIVNGFLGIGMIPVSLFILVLNSQIGLLSILGILLIIRFFVYFIGYRFRQSQLKPIKEEMEKEG